MKTTLLKMPTDTPWQRPLRHLRKFCLHAAASVLAIASALAAPGDLDPSFGNGGKVITAGYGSFGDVAWQTDGKALIVLEGSSGFNVIRLLPNGAPDPSFGVNGVVTTTSLGLDYGVAYAVAVQSDGKVLLAGRKMVPGPTFEQHTYEFAVARYDSTGALDTGFGTGGVVTTPMPGATSTLPEVRMALQGDGKIVLAGTVKAGLGEFDMVTVRYTATGTLDGTFGSGGVVTTSFGTTDFPTAVGIQTDGKILLAGVSDNRLALVRYTSTGALDSAFGTGGLAATSLNGNVQGTALAIQPDGKILIAGSTSNFSPDWDIGLARFTTSGALDPAFGTAGTVITSLGSGADGASNLVLQSDGKILVAGWSYRSDFNSDFALVRYTASGTLDPSFGGVGSVTTAIDGDFDYPGGVFVQGDGKIVVAGSSTLNGFSAFALARYIGIAPPVVTTGTATPVASTTATLTGTVNPNGLASTAQFEYGLTTAYGSTAGVALSPNAGNSAQNVGANLANLLSGTTYHYHLIAQNMDGTALGEDMTLTTLTAPEIRVFAGATEAAPELVDGQVSAVDFGSTPLGTPVVRSFTVKNMGPGTLDLTSLSLPAGYQLDLPFGPLTLAVNATHTFQVRFLANTVKGVFSGNISLGNNDPDEAPFDFPVTAQSINTLNPATLDRTFAGTGKAVTAFGSNGDDAAQAIAVQSDGKLVVVGYAFNGTNSDFAVARYLANGEPDPTFGNGGVVLTDITGGDDYARAVAIQPDGKIVVAGSAFDGVDDDFAVARYNPDGTPDNSFDDNGRLRTAIGSENDRAWALALQSDGKIVVAGATYDGADWNFAVVRYTTVGALDTTFSSDGKQITAVSSNSDICQGVVIQSNGRIILAGYYNNSGNNDIVLVRYTTAGALDTSFSGDGIATFSISSGNDQVRDVALQSDGKILVAGESSNGSNYDFALARLTTAGALDTTFDADGKQTTAFGAADDRAEELVVLSDGRIVVAGHSSNGNNLDFAVARYLTDGTLDLTFGTGGKATTAIGNGDDSGEAVAVQNDGKIVVAGYAHNGTNRDFALVRYGSELTPTVVTSAVSALTTTSATLQGTVNPNGVLTNAWFEYGPTTSYGSTTAAVPQGYATVPLAISAPVGGFAPGTTWHYRAVAQNGETTVVGADMTFTTLIPEIRVFAGADTTAPELTDGQVAAVDFGNTPLGTPVTRSFTVQNAGTTDLQLTSLSLPPGYAHVGGFAALTLAPSASHTFQVRFLANTVKGVFGGSVGLGNNDLDEAPFDFSFTARAINPLNPASLDPEFDSDGMLTTNISGSDLAEDVAIQSDGKIVVAGYSGANINFSVARYWPDGRLDTTFGAGGKVTTPVGSSSDYGYSVAIQSDGKIVVAGSADISGWPDFAVVRYTADGALDTTFGVGGKVTIAFGSENDVCQSVALQSDGKIVAAGYSWNGSQYVFAVARLTSTGALDTSFSSDGKVTTAIGGFDFGHEVAIQADGKIVVGGYSDDGSKYVFAVVRYTTTGGLDSTFSSDGKATLAFGTATATARGMSLQSDGKIVLAGSVEDASSVKFGVARFTSAGAADTTFGTAGKVTTLVGQNAADAESVAVQTDGKILVAGSAKNGGNYDFALLRYTSDGVLDQSFGTGGQVITAIDSSNDFARAVAVQSDEKHVVVGSALIGGSYDFALVRYGRDLEATAVTTAASAITQNSATLNGTVNPNGVITNAWFEYGATTNYGSTTAATAVGYGPVAVPVAAILGSMTPSTIRHYRIVAQNGETTVYGADMVFTTAEGNGPIGGTMTLSSSALDAGAPLTVSFAGWTDSSLPLSYSILVNFAEVSAPGASATRNLVSPTTPGAYTIQGVIRDALGNATTVTQGFTVLTAQETWRRTHFGDWSNTGDAADSADPDGDGHANHFEFVAGLVPNSAASRFQLRVAPVNGQPTQKALVFGPVQAGRSYVVKYKNALTEATWTTLTNIATSDNGNERTVTDLLTTSTPRYYRVEITKP